MITRHKKPEKTAVPCARRSPRILTFSASIMVLLRTHISPYQISSQETIFRQQSLIRRNQQLAFQLQLSNPATKGCGIVCTIRLDWPDRLFTSLESCLVFPQTGGQPPGCYKQTFNHNLHLKKREYSTACVLNCRWWWPLIESSPLTIPPPKAASIPNHFSQKPLGSASPL